MGKFLYTCVQVVEEMPNVRKMASFGIGGQLVHRLSDDASPIHHILLGMDKKQGGSKGKSDVIWFFRTEDRH